MHGLNTIRQLNELAAQNQPAAIKQTLDSAKKFWEGRESVTDQAFKELKAKQARSHHLTEQDGKQVYI